jgi:hypothetical protein
VCENSAQKSAGHVQTFALVLWFVMCEQPGMEKPTVTTLATRAGISKSYACEILGDRQPARPLAIHIFRTTGWKHPVIADLTREQIDMLESIEPWTPRPTHTEQAA